MDEIALTREQSLDGIGQIPGNLAHPQSVCRSRDPADLHPPRRQLDKEENEKALQSFGRPDLDGEEVRCNDHFPMLCQKLLPGCFAAALRCRFDAIALQNVGHSAVCQIVAQIQQCTNHARVAQARFSTAICTTSDSMWSSGARSAGTTAGRSHRTFERSAFGAKPAESQG